MRIQHNIAAMNSYRNYNSNANALNKNLEKLSSGYRINRAGDDAAGLAISEKMRAQIAGLDQAQNNVKDGISLIKTAEGALQEVQDMMNRMVTLATQSANGTYDDEVDRAALQEEVDSLLSEIDRIADSSNFNGMYLFSENENVTSIQLQIGDSSDEYNQLNLGDLVDTGSLKDILTAGDITVTSIDDAKAALDKLKGTSDAPAAGAINQVSTLRGQLGAIQNRLEHTSSNLSVMTENIQDAESTIRDTDIADEMTAYTKNNILLQSAQAMLAQANQMPQGVLQLLQ